MKHLRDEEIQEYLDRVAPADKERVERHLAACPGCRTALDWYRLLYSGLADGSMFVEQPTLTQEVLGRIEKRHSHKSLSILEDALLLAGVVAASTVGLLWFVDLKPLLQGLSAGGISVAPSVVFAAGAVIVITNLLNGSVLRRRRPEGPHS